MSQQQTWNNVVKNINDKKPAYWIIDTIKSCNTKCDTWVITKSKGLIYWLAKECP